MQLPLWAVQLVRVDPWPQEESAELWATGEDHAGQRWALRSTRGHRADAPLIEWLCYRLCDLLHIANPGYAVCQTSEGELVFGSRWADDAWQYAPHWTKRPLFRDRTGREGRPKRLRLPCT